MRACFTVVALLCVSGVARAGTFDPSGNFSFDPSAVATIGFNQVDDPSLASEVKLVHGGDAIEGAAYVNINDSNGSVTFPVTLPAVDGAYAAHMFVRTNRVEASVTVTYPNDGGSLSFNAWLNPSGIVTSDGWYEVVTNTFSVEGSRNPTVALSIYATGADVDAFEIDPQGTFKALTRCSPPFDPVCGPNELCENDWCHDGNVLVPPLPPTTERDDVLAYFRARMSTFFGGRYSRLNYLPNALATIDALHDAATPWQFWDGILTAIRRLHDWHTTLSGPLSLAPRPVVLPVCFDEGAGDLSDSIVAKDPTYYDVLVSEVGPKSPTLAVGDRLVAVDGMHPFAFADTLETVDFGMWRADDPDAHAEPAERMSGIIRRFAHDLTFIHCDRVAMTCGAPQTIPVDSLPADDGTYSTPYCDHRPQYHISGPNPATHDSYNGPFYGVVNESNPGENIYGMVWDDVYVDSTTNDYTAAYAAFQSSASAVILDHRLGNGGDVEGATYLTSLFRAPATIAALTNFDLTVGELDNYTTSYGLSLYSTFLGSNGYPVGSTTARTNLPVALMLARDGSASDWFPRGMKGAGANVQLFGRHTAGAFSSYFVFDYYAGLGWRLASGDLLNPDGTTNLGSGVVPDNTLVPLQSDLLAGRDTVYLAALDWVRTCTACRQ